MSFEDRLFHVVRNFMEYGNYGGRKGAVKAIARHHRDRSAGECERAFDDFLRAYGDAIPFVEKHVEYYRELYARKTVPRDGDGRYALSAFERDFAAAHGTVPERSIITMIWFIFDWRHVR